MRVLALDVGSSSVRAIVYDEGAREVEGASSRGAYQPIYGRDGEAELQPDLLVEAARTALDEARERARAQMDAVAISSFWHSLLLLDAAGRPLTPVLLWQDRRAVRQAEDLRRRLDPEEVHARTGCVLHPSYWPAKLAWLATERADVLARAARAVSFPDYLFLRLTGEVRTTLSIASGTGLLDLRRRCWDPELLAALQLDPELLPPLSDQPAGKGKPMFPPLGDGACSNLGAGCTGPERAALMIGTSGAYRVVRDAEHPQPQPGLFSYFLDEHRIVEGGAVSDGGNLYAWLERTLRIDRPVVREPDAHGLTFLPLLGGERSPNWNLEASGAIAGLTLNVGAGDILQAALEAVAYRFAEIAALLPGVREIVATGHAILSAPTWIQLCADVLGRPVAASAVAEGSARGAAVHALERLGVEPDPAPLGRLYEPDPERTEIYARARERQRALYRKLFQLF
jgi:gluconokinase